LKLAARALSTLQELGGLENPTDVQRDAAIQRFEYSFEAVWKAAQRFLLVIEGQRVGSPKSTIRASLQSGLLTEEMTEHALQMVDDRNLTSHTYNEALAKAIFSRVPRHIDVLQTWLEAMRDRMANS
jgi:nucleotidyltransferase substrate binding protein (TIGR01987 family)